MQEFLDIGRREVPNDVDVVFGIFGDATRDAGQGLGDLTDVVRSEEHYRGEDLFGDLLNSGRDCPGAPRLGLLVPERYTGGSFGDVFVEFARDARDAERLGLRLVVPSLLPGVRFVVGDDRQDGEILLDRVCGIGRSREGRLRQVRPVL